jgi:hypothetical protein
MGNRLSKNWCPSARTGSQPSVKTTALDHAGLWCAVVKPRAVSTPSRSRASATVLGTLVHGERESPSYKTGLKRQKLQSLSTRILIREPPDPQ